MKHKDIHKGQIERSEAFKQAAMPLIKYLAENHHPHVTAIITSTSCELLEGISSQTGIHEFLVDKE